MRPVAQLGRTVALWARLGTAARTTQGQLLLGVAAGILLLAALVLVVGRLTPPPAPAERPAAPPAAEVPLAKPTAPPEPAGAPPATPGPTTVKLFREALPLLLGVFWLLASWLVDAEAKRVFVVREPWGERRTLGYSCLAVGCVFPLIVAALIFSAWGSVRLILWLYDNQSPSAALRAAFLLMGLLAAFFVLRAALTRWLAMRSGQS